MAFKIFDAATATGVSSVIKVGDHYTSHRLDISFESLAATKISDLTVELQGSSTKDDADTGVITNPTLAVGSTPERFANATFAYRINGTNYTKAVNAAGTVFTSVNTVTLEKYGCINIYIDASGNWLTLPGVTTQAYTTAVLAHTAADLITAGPDYCYVGRILILADSGNWVGKTDSMTDDLTSATFLSQTSSFITLGAITLDANEIIYQKATTYFSDTGAKYIRGYISDLTGTGTVTVRYQPFKG